MRYFTDELNDIKGYLEQLKMLKDRLHNDVFMFFATDSFHDSHIFSLKVTNKFDPNNDEGGKDPTIIEAHLLHSNGEEYLVNWIGVRKFLMDYDIERNTYSDSNEKNCI